MTPKSPSTQSPSTQAPAIDPSLLPPLPTGAAVQVARVVRSDRGACEVLSGGVAMRVTWGAGLVVAAATDPGAAPAAGDWVALAVWPDARVTVEAVLPRGATVRRAQVARGSSHAQVLAANVDLVAVVEALVPDLDAGRLERLLALAWSSGAQPVVVLTKADLVPQAADLVEEVALLAPACPVLAVGAPSGQGLDDVRTLLAGRTTALLGASGAGKSTLLNALLGVHAMGTRELRADGRGRHTTVTRELHVLPGGGEVIDTPGLRTIGLVGEEPLEDVFAEVGALAARCRFDDCRHESEPGCAVLSAVNAGGLPERRLLSYRKLCREAEYQAARTDARLRAERTKRWRAVQRSVRARGYRP